jgi:hypothetical protein
MLRAILISLFIGAVGGAVGFYFGHAYATKVWKEVVFKLEHARDLAHEEIARLKAKL